MSQEYLWPINVTSRIRFEFHDGLLMWDHHCILPQKLCPASDHATPPNPLLHLPERAAAKSTAHSFKLCIGVVKRPASLQVHRRKTVSDIPLPGSSRSSPSAPAPLLPPSFLCSGRSKKSALYESGIYEAALGDARGMRFGRPVSRGGLAVPTGRICSRWRPVIGK